jgi:hypothetical protein
MLAQFPLLSIEIDCLKNVVMGFFSSDFFFFSNFREKPLVVMPDKIFSLDDHEEIEEWLEKRLLRMPASQRQKFYDLSDSRFDENK